MDMDREMCQGDDTTQGDDVWPPFDRKIINGELKVERKYCHKKLAGSSRSGTSHLREHITKSFDANISREYLAEMIIVHEYPLVIVEHHGILEKKSNRNYYEHVDIKQQKKGFMTITAHCIDDNWNLQSRLMRIRETLTPKRVEKFEEAARHLDIPSLRTLAIDCKTHWYSTYLMLEVVIIYKDVFRHLKQWDARYKMEDEEDEVIKDIAEQMILKFDKYWSDIHGFMGVATVLDLRMKLKIMKFSFSKLYHSKQRAEEEFTKLKKFVSALFIEYDQAGNSKFIEEEEDETSDITSEDTIKLDHYLKERVCNPT
ncbi:zinc finger BED domain-containing protein RICESLEEPER 2-like protein [Tanacetum coccineum]